MKKTNVKKAAAPTPVPEVPKSHLLRVHVKPGETQDRAVAGIVGHGLVTNASTAIRFLQAEHKDLSLMDMARELRDQGQAVNRGDLAVAERMLNAQAVALNTIFAEMARRAALNMGEHLGATETYMRLALKAQAQCRATIEALAEMKNPRAVAFVKQANIANGPQQVNNGAQNSAASANANVPAHAGKSRNEPIKLLEQQHGEWLDPGTQSATSGTHQDMATVGTVDRPANRAGKGRRITQRMERGAT